MKKLKFALLALVMSLASCAPTTVDSSTNSDTSTNIPSQSETSSSEVVEENWSEMEINFMKEYLFDYVIPYIPIEGADPWVYDNENDVVTYQKHLKAKVSDGQYFYDQIMRVEGYQDLTSFEAAPGDFYKEVGLYLTNEIEVRIAIEVSNHQFFADAFIKPYTAKWNETKMNEVFFDFLGEQIKFPVPSFEYKRLFLNIVPAKDDVEILVVSIYTDTNEAQTYANQLIEKEFTMVETSGQLFFRDKNNKSQTLIGYNVIEKSVDLYIAKTTIK